MGLRCHCNQAKFDNTYEYTLFHPPARAGRHGEWAGYVEQHLFSFVLAAKPPKRKKKSSSGEASPPPNPHRR
ncbi:MAG: hypothetical protein EI684_15765 [Candidatus Viridilinea halotolerans]|uniref:Uncharacterized protein n=1 Tax=Candidatus Viridilinea halotolerans TaxID=2491704 RepID=A0A426TVB8_9CHLR|nr:MAG: hypothetical protein EI684_15765 [Candidatus Viridilinea halotolerans]